jgi:hypothetical protein
LTGVRLHHLKSDAGEVTLKRPGRVMKRGEKRHRYDDSEPKGSCLSTSCLPCYFLHALDLRQGGLRFGEHQSSGLRQLNAFVRAREQLNAQITLHRLNPLRQWRLGHMKPLRSPAEVPLLGYGDKAGELSHSELRWHDIDPLFAISKPNSCCDFTLNRRRMHALNGGGRVAFALDSGRSPGTE